jgi:hypothetical protein
MCAMIGTACMHASIRGINLGVQGLNTRVPEQAEQRLQTLLRCVTKQVLQAV